MAYTVHDHEQNVWNRWRKGCSKRGTYPGSCHETWPGRCLCSFQRNQHKPTIMVGCDTRISGDMLANALMAGAAP